MGKKRSSITIFLNLKCVSSQMEISSAQLDVSNLRKEGIGLVEKKMQK